MLRRININRIATVSMFLLLVGVLLIPIFIGLGLWQRAMPILDKYPIEQLLFGTEWMPMQGQFGFFAFIISSIVVTIISALVAVPLCLLSAIYLTQYASKRLLNIMNLSIDILAGIPSVVYGVWGILVIVPFVSYLASLWGIQTAGYSLLSGGLILAIMTIPYSLNLLLEVFQQIPIELTEVSLSLGANRWQTIKHVLIRRGFSGILSAFSLGISKAFGETMAVLMVVGNVVNVPQTVFDSGYPLPALIANNYGEMMSIPLYDSALMLTALLLFIVIFAFNFFAHYLIYKSEV